MVSYDVCGLFTNIPLKETIDLAVDIIFDNNQSMNITKPQLRKLFVFATSQTHFLFINEVYDQTDGVAMGSPLGLALANLFMGYHENKWLNSEESSTVLFYKRYVDDIFCLFKCETDAERFLSFLNRQHPNIKFTIEKEKNKKVPFLDILNDSSSNKLVTSVYRKPTYTGLLTNYNSFTSPNYKKGLIKTLIDRTFRINSTWSGFHYDILNLKSVLQKNEFPLKLIDKSISKYLSNNVFKQKENEQMPLLESSKKRFYKLPHIGNFSIQTKKKLNNIVLKYCKPNTNIELALSSYKISSLFSMKDRVPFDLRSYVVYKFVCGSCKADYIGRTKRHLSTRIKEHLETDKKSHVYKHLNESQRCKALSNNDCFSILDYATTQYSSSIKEGMHIGWQKPVLNKHVDFLACSICV